MVKTESTMAQALKHIAFIKCKNVKMQNGFIIASGETCSIGFPIPEQFEAYPDVKQLKTVLKQTSSDYSITAQDNVLSVVAENFRGCIACNETQYYDDLSHTSLESPDIGSVACDNSIISAITSVLPSATCAQDKPISHCVFIGNSSVFSCDGVSFSECSHRIAFPGICSIPVLSAKVLSRFKLAVSSIGGSNNSLTIHFENGAWFKTLLTSEKFNERAYSYLTTAKNNCLNMVELTEKGRSAILSVGETSLSGIIVFSNDGVFSSEDFDNACSSNGLSISDTYAFHFKRLSHIKKTNSGFFQFFDFKLGESASIACMFFKSDDLCVLTVGNKLEKTDEEVPF